MLKERDNTLKKIFSIACTPNDKISESHVSFIDRQMIVIHHQNDSDKMKNTCQFNVKSRRENYSHGHPLFLRGLSEHIRQIFTSLAL